MWYVDDIRALCDRAKTCPSPPQITLETDSAVCPSNPLPVSLLTYYYEVVFNDIQIHTYITIIIPPLELHLRRMMPSAIVFVCTLVSLYVCVCVCVCVSPLLVDLHDNKQCCSLTVPWWGVVLIQLKRGRRAARNVSISSNWRSFTYSSQIGLNCFLMVMCHWILSKVSDSACDQWH